MLHQYETLEHIYLKCPHSNKLFERVAGITMQEVDPLFIYSPSVNITLLQDNLQLSRILIVANY